MFIVYSLQQIEIIPIIGRIIKSIRCSCVSIIKDNICVRIIKASLPQFYPSALLKLTGAQYIDSTDFFHYHLLTSLQCFQQQKAQMIELTVTILSNVNPAKPYHYSTGHFFCSMLSLFLYQLCVYFTALRDAIVLR